MRWRERRALTAELVSDCEAFLLGRYAERLSARGMTVPVWAWTNLLAHGSEADLRAEAQAARAPDGPPGWRAARGTLAAQLLQATGPGCSLAQLQASVLAPLELRLANRPIVERWDRRTWIETVRAALASHRPTHHP